MNVVVVGGAGFIGSHLVDRLLAESHHVDVIDDLSTGTLGNLAEARAAGGSLKIHHLDAASPEAASLIGMRRPDVVFHLAAFPRRATSIQEHGVSFTRSLAVIEAARQHRVGRIVVALPATSLYGHPAANSLPVKENNPEPLGVRGVVARAVLDVLSEYREAEGLEFAALSLASVYGPRQAPGGGVIAAFHNALISGKQPEFHGDGRQTRDFVYVDDVVDALVRAADRSSGLLINIGSGQQTAVRDLWNQMSGGAFNDPIELPGRRNEVQRFAVSSVRARIHLGWSPWTDLTAGLARVRLGN